MAPELPGSLKPFFRGLALGLACRPIRLVAPAWAWRAEASRALDSSAGRWVGVAGRTMLSLPESEAGDAARPPVRGRMPRRKRASSWLKKCSFSGMPGLVTLIGGGAAFVFLHLNVWFQLGRKAAAISKRREVVLKHDKPWRAWLLFHSVS